MDSYFDDEGDDDIHGSFFMEKNSNNTKQFACTVPNIASYKNPHPMLS